MSTKESFDNYEIANTHELDGTNEKMAWMMNEVWTASVVKKICFFGWWNKTI